MKVNSHNKTAMAFQEEFDGMRDQLETKHRQELQRGEQVHSQKQRELNRANEALRAELEQAQKQSQAHLEKIGTQEKTICRLREELPTQHNTTDLQSEVTDLHSLCLNLREERESLQCEVAEKDGEVEMLRSELCLTRERVEAMEEEIGDRVKQSND